MIDVASQIIFCLVVAVAIGFVVAWFLRGAIERNKADEVSGSWAALEPEMGALRRSLAGKEQEVAQLRTRLAALEPLPRAVPEPATRVGEPDTAGLGRFGERKVPAPAAARSSERNTPVQGGFGERRAMERPHWMRDADKIEPRVSAAQDGDSEPGEERPRDDAVLRYMDEQIERLTARIADLEAAERKPGAPATPGAPRGKPEEDMNKT